MHRCECSLIFEEYYNGNGVNNNTHGGAISIDVNSKAISTSISGVISHENAFILLYLSECVTMGFTSALFTLPIGGKPIVKPSIC